MTKTKEELRNGQIVANMVNKIRKDRHPSWSRDQLLCHPREAMSVCESVRQVLPLMKDWDDCQILWTYLNYSKRSKVATCLPRRKHR